VPSDIKWQTHGFAESPFVIFKNVRARKMSHDFLIRGSGCASFAPYAFRNSTGRALQAGVASAMLAQNHQLIAAQRQHRAGVRHPTQ
jgi:hypothetical protein